jgi:hypothetical protein
MPQYISTHQNNKGKKKKPRRVYCLVSFLTVIFFRSFPQPLMVSFIIFVCFLQRIKSFYFIDEGNHQS